MGFYLLPRNIAQFSVDWKQNKINKIFLYFFSRPPDFPEEGEEAKMVNTFWQPRIVTKTHRNFSSLKKKFGSFVIYRYFEYPLRNTLCFKLHTIFFGAADEVILTAKD